VSLVLTLVLLVRPWGDGIVQAFDNLATAAAALVGGTVCLWRSRRAGPLRPSWTALGIGILGWGVGQSIWSWYELVAHREVPLPSAADAGFLLFPIAGAVALLLWPRRRGSPDDRLRHLLDGLIIACSLLILSLESVLTAVLDTGSGTTFATAIATAYPVGDLAVATMTLLALTHLRRCRRQLVPLAVGMLCLIVADSVFAFQNARGTYATGSLSDVGWAAGFLLLGLVATSPTLGRRAVGQHDADDNLDGHGATLAVARPSILQLAFPYAPPIAATLVFLLHLGQGRPVSAGMAGAGMALVLLVYSRQFVTLVENRRLVKAVQHQALHDSLTGLANRALFLDRLEAALRSPAADRSSGVAVAFLDLDDFKEVNDGLGHAAGDALLVGVGERLRGGVRSGDLVARLGGDEFGVLLCGTADDQSVAGDDPTAVAERLVEVLREPFEVGGHRLTVTASIGLTQVDADDRGASALHILRNADLAMYSAKQSGKSRFAAFDTDMSRALLAELQLRKELAVAVAEDQFFLLYQPLYDLRENRLCGAEALVRWAHPSGSTLPPSAFLRHAETVALMPALGQLLLRRACRETRAWLDRHAVPPDFFVSVNLSALQLADSALPAFVATVLDEHGLEPHRLLLEVTESALLTDVDAAAAVLSDLVALGVRIALDDFGTGYSSLAHLHQLPVQVLKTDGSFVASLDQPDGDPGLVALVAEIGSSLGLVTVGEGVETVEQLEELRRLGYGIAQGYLLGRPGPLAALRQALVAPMGSSA
jgi:diguanylate cyclase (GGDEF)-like protein